MLEGDVLGQEFTRLEFAVQKIDKRLHIVLRENEKLTPIPDEEKRHLRKKGPTIVYTPPKFIRFKATRKELEILAEVISACDPRDRISAIINFESRLTKCQP